MYCPKCWKENKETAKFCQYCGCKLNRTNLQTSLPNVDKEKDALRGGLFIFGIIAVIVLIVGVLVARPPLRCDYCGKTIWGHAYTEEYDNGTVMCEQCAKKYYMGFDYSAYQIR